MQELSDEVETLQDKVRDTKDKMKKGALEVEALRLERAEAEKSVKVEVDDGRWLPLYDWYAPQLLHRPLADLYAGSHRHSQCTAASSICNPLNRAPTMRYGCHTK